jgi:hypothetical protein
MKFKKIKIQTIDNKFIFMIDSRASEKSNSLYAAYGLIIICDYCQNDLLPLESRCVAPALQSINIDRYSVRYKCCLTILLTSCQKSNPKTEIKSGGFD